MRLHSLYDLVIQLLLLGVRERYRRSGSLRNFCCANNAKLAQPLLMLCITSMITIAITYSVNAFGLPS